MAWSIVSGYMSWSWAYSGHILETGNRGPAEPEPANSDKSYMRACVKLPAGAGANLYICIACKAAAEPGKISSSDRRRTLTYVRAKTLLLFQRTSGAGDRILLIIYGGPSPGGLYPVDRIKASPERLSVSTWHFLAKSEQIPTPQTKRL